VSPPERVVDLDHHDPQGAGLVAAEEEACRVEHVPQHAQVGHQHDPPGRRILPLGTEVRPDVRGDVSGGDGQVVGVAERGGRAAVAPEQPQAPVHVVQLGQVQRRVPDIVLHPVRERARPAVADLALEQM